MVSVPLSSQAPGPDEEAGSRQQRRGRIRDEANFEAMPDGVPPQNLEAEEAVLGGILLDPDAIGRVADVLQPEAF
ncbi:MAG: DnaB-like helicase N-terminal domain-containing protein, partial [Vulcanococcus sp.]